MFRFDGTKRPKHVVESREYANEYIEIELH